MSGTNSTIHCPVCNSLATENVFSVKDYTVSGELFDIRQCRDCSLRFTFPVPDENKIKEYYQSEDYISHNNASKGIINSIYRIVRNFTVRSKRKLVRKVSGLQHGILLDIGSGTGFFAAEMMKSGWMTTGLEPDDGARAAASVMNNIELMPSETIYDLSPQSFDVITLWHVLEHVHDLHGYMKKIHSLLKPQGKLIIAVPNHTSLDAEKFQNYWAAYDVPRHLYHFNPQSLKRLAEIHSFILNGMKPMWFDSFYVCLLSSRYKSGKTKWITAIWTACRSNMRALKDKSLCSSVIYVLGKS